MHSQRVVRRVSVAVMAGLLAASTVGSVTSANSFEVWLIDQSNTRADGGGTLYIYAGAALEGQAAAGAAAEVIDLGGAVRDLCLAQTGTSPVRPHMLEFDMGHRYGVLAFVGTGHVVFIEAATRAPVTCIDVGAQAHAAFPTPDGTAVIVANQNGKQLQRIATDFATGTFALEPGGLDLVNGTTPSGAPREAAGLRPDNAPICPVIDSTSRFAFATLRGGGLFVVDIKATPMQIVAEYDMATVQPNGCGGVEHDGRMYITSGGGTPANPYSGALYAFDLSAFSTSPAPVNTPAPQTIYRTPLPAVVDTHGAILTKAGRHLWVADRATNEMTVVETATATIVNTFGFAGAVSSDPAVDLLDISPAGNRIFGALRGPVPLTGNAPAVGNAVGSTPGLGVFRVTGDGRHGVLQSVVPVTHIVNGAEAADPHAIKVRRT